MSVPSPTRIATRALALCAVVARAYLEEAAHDAHTEQLRKDMLAWLNTLDLSDALTEREGKLMQRPVGRLSQREQVDASWLCEGLAILAWALGRFEWPELDAQVDPRRVVDSLGFLREESTSLRAIPTLRPEEDLAVAQARLQLLRDRLDAFETERAHVDLCALARGAPLGDKLLAGLVLERGDLRVDGKALLEADPMRVGESHAALEERLGAMSWLRGAAGAYGLRTPLAPADARD